MTQPHGDYIEQLDRNVFVSLDVDNHEHLLTARTRFEALVLDAALRRNDGHRQNTARDLGYTREGLWKLMRRLKPFMPARV